MSNALQLVPNGPDTSELSAESSALVHQAAALAVVDGASYESAADFGKGIKALQRRIVEFFAPHKQNAHKAWKALCEEETRQLAPTEKAEAVTKRKMLDFRAAEQRRQDEERRAREVQARKLEEDRRLQDAIELEAEGDAVGAEEVLAQPIVTPVVRVPLPAAPKIAGVAATKRWTFDDAVDLAAIVRHLAGIPQDQPLAHPELLNLLAINKVATRQAVVMMGENFNVPGIRAYQDDGLSFGSK